MRVFVTGATGFIGSALVTDLLGAGHEVVGLARSAAAEDALLAAGAQVCRGELADLDVLRNAARAADGVAHLGFVHDFSNFEAALRTDVAAIGALLGGLEGSGKPLTIAAGTLGLGVTDRPATETDGRTGPRHPRAAAGDPVLAAGKRGVRGSVVRLAPTVHGAGERGFVPWIIACARQHGCSGYVGDGTTRWAAVHRSDAARLFRLALESAPAGTVLHGVAEEAVTTREIAELVGRGLDLPVAPVHAAAHFGWLAPMLAMDSPISSAHTRELLDWTPTGPTLAEDLVPGGAYFTP